MRTLITLVATLVVVGCAEPPKARTETVVLAAAEEPEDGPDCRGRGAGTNRADCTILVNVAVNGSTCTVTVGTGQDAVEFIRGASNVWVLWQLDTRPRGYRFAAREGIKFKNDVNDNFVRCRSFGNGQLFRCRNSNGPGDDGEYEYGINIVDSRGNLACPGDPKIINR